MFEWISQELTNQSGKGKAVERKTPQTIDCRPKLVR